MEPHQEVHGLRLLLADEGFTEVHKLAKDITKEDLMLIRNDITIEFRDRPIDNQKDVLITVSLAQEKDNPVVGTHLMKASK